MAHTLEKKKPGTGEYWAPRGEYSQPQVTPFQGKREKPGTLPLSRGNSGPEPPRNRQTSATATYPLLSVREFQLREGPEETRVHRDFPSSVASRTWLPKKRVRI